MDLNTTLPHLEHTASPSRGVDSTFPAGTHTCMNAVTQLRKFFTITGRCLIQFSPIEVKISPEAGQQKVRAWGPGLEGGVVGKSADFVVEAVGDDVGTLGECTCKSIGFIQACVGIIHIFLIVCVQGSLLRVHLRPRLNVMTKVTDPVMCATGPQSLVSTPFTCCATMKTSSTPPSWLRSSLLRAKTSTQTR